MLSPRSGPVPLCLHAREGCAGAAVCRFAGVAEPKLRILARGARVPLNPDERGLTVRAVRSGLVAMAADSPAGRRQILCLNGPGELVCPTVPRAGGVRLEALSRTTLCEIDMTAQADRLLRDPAFATQLLALARNRVDDAANQLLALGRLDGTARLARFIADLARRHGHRQGAMLSLALPMSREDIADCLGLTPETVSRILTRLRKAGLLRLHSPTVIELPDNAALSRLAGAEAIPA